MFPAIFVFLVDEFGDVLFVGSMPPWAEISVLCLVCVVFVAPWGKLRRCGGELYFWCVAFRRLPTVCGVVSAECLCLTDWFVTRETARMSRFVPGFCSVNRPGSND